MIDDLNEIEARVLGALVEKDLATPDQYPLSLNALVLACNQKSNREPVMAIGEGEVVEALDALTARHLVREKNPAGSRVSKYAHRLSGGLSVGHDLDRNQLGALCVLILRGPQTPGEIRARAGRLGDLREPGAVERTLETLASAERGPFVVRLPRAPGRKEARYAHTLCGEPSQAVSAASGSSAASGEAPLDLEHGEERLEALERRVDELERALDALRERLAAGTPGAPGEHTRAPEAPDAGSRS